MTNNDENYDVSMETTHIEIDPASIEDAKPAIEIVDEGVTAEEVPAKEATYEFESSNPGVVPTEPIGMEVSEPVNPTAAPEQPKKKKKGLAVVLVIVLLILALVCGAYFYLKTSFTAEKFLDTSVSEVNKWIDKTFDTILVNNEYNLLEKDVVTTGTFTASTDIKEYKSISDLSIDFSNSLSIDKQLESLKLTLKEKDSSVISGTLSLNGSKAYVESEVLDTTLSTRLEQNIFELLDNKEIVEKISVDDVRKFAKEVVTNLGESLKEADLSTETKGLTVNYIYKINEKNSEKITSKFKSLMEKNELYKTITSMSENNEDIDIDTEVEIKESTFTVTVDILKNRIESFTLKNEDEEIKGTRVGDNKYRFGTEEDYVIFEINNDTIKAEIYSEKELDGKMVLISKKDEIYIEVEADGTKLSMDYRSNKNNAAKVVLNIETKDIKAAIDIDESFEGDTVKDNIAADVTYQGSNVKVTIDASSKYGKDLVKEKQFGYTTDFDELTERDSINIMSNILNKVKDLELIENMVNSPSTGITMN